MFDTFISTMCTELLGTVLVTSQSSSEFRSLPKSSPVNLQLSSESVIFPRSRPGKIAT